MGESVGERAAPWEPLGLRVTLGAGIQPPQPSPEEQGRNPS